MAATSLRPVAVAVDVFLPAPPPRKPTSPSLSFHPLLSAKPRPLPLPLRLRSTRRLPLPPLAASDDEAVQGFGRALRLGQTDDEAVLDREGEGLQEAVGGHGEPPEEANVFVGNLPLDVDSERRAGAAALGWGEPDADEAVLDPEGEGLQVAVGRFVEPPEEVKVFVGNLPYDVDSERLAQLFDQAGVVEVAEVIYNRETGQSRGFGFVTMSSVEEADKAVEMLSRYEISGRLLTVNKAAPRGSRAEGPPPPRQFGPSFRAYVGNLPWQVDDSRLMQLFSEHGEVVDARVVYDRETGRSRGFGFVRMASKEELNSAITALDGQSLDGRELRVNVAEERPRRGF